MALTGVIPPMSAAVFPRLTGDGAQFVTEIGKPHPESKPHLCCILHNNTPIISLYTGKGHVYQVGV